LVAFVCFVQVAWSAESKLNVDVVPVVEDPYGGGGGGMMGGKMGGGKMGGKMPGGGGGGMMGGKMGGSPKTPAGGKMGGTTPKMGGKTTPPAGGGKINPPAGGGKMATAGKRAAGTGAAHHGSTGAGAAAQPAPVTSSDSRRDQLVACGKALYDNRAKEHYTEGGSRWNGITSRVRPPNAPTYSDCSSAVSWCYWTVFGNGPDILNGDGWKGGYTGTMPSHGTVIPCSQMQPGDVALYGSSSSWEHAEMYMGNGYMVSHGMDPVSYLSSTSLQGFAKMQCRRYF